MLSHIASFCNRLGTNCFKPKDEPGESNELASRVVTAGDERFAKVIENTAHLQGPTSGLAKSFQIIPERPAPGANTTVIDLGAGGGRDTRTLAERGWQVTAIDPRPETGEKLVDAGERVRVHQGTLLDVDMPAGSVARISAQRVLPFIRGEALNQTLQRAFELLEPGGHLCASFFGPQHDWMKDPKKSATRDFHSMEDAKKLMKNAGFQIRHLSQEQGPMTTGEGERLKNWHEVFVVVQKPARRSSESARQQALLAQVRRSSDDSMAITPA